MSLKEFDAVTGRMMTAFEYAQSLGQYQDAAKILYQMNEELPEDLQLDLGELEGPDDAKPFITRHLSEVKSLITQYRQRLMD